MNYLVTADSAMVQKFKGPLQERGRLTCLADVAALQQQAASAGSGLAVIDVATPGYAGESAIRRLKLVNAQLKVLLVGGHLPPPHELSALAAGAMGCCDASLGVEQVRRILTVIEEGGVWISNAALPHLLLRLRTHSNIGLAEHAPEPATATEGLDGLTHREREIAHMVASGESNKVIARQLNITERTVKAHLTTIFQKLHMHDRLQLALFVNRVPQ